MAFSVMSTIAMDKDNDFRNYPYDVAPYSMSLWQRLSTIKIELELELGYGHNEFFGVNQYTQTVYTCSRCDQLFL